MVRGADGRPRRTRAPVLAQGALLAIAAISLGYFGYVHASAFVYQSYEGRRLEAALARAAADDDVPRLAYEAGAPAHGSVLGRIEIPRLGLSAIVRAGSDEETLRLAVGHIPGTALPGDPGNVGLAGHRDTFFRGLGEVRPDDEIRLVTPGGTHRYRVEASHVVQPEDVWVLDSTGAAILTLVTCHPFSFVGPAPDRFIVRARLVGGA